jgi:hypothetical protein
MTLSCRSLRRASVVTLAALTSVACSDAIAPLDVTPGHLEMIAHSTLFEIHAGVATLTAAGAMNTDYWPNLTMPSFHVVDPECRVFSQSPPADSDADGVPDNFTITFAVPACRFPEETGYRDLTGVIRISDPHPGMVSPAFNMALDDFRITVAVAGANGFIRREGMMVVSATASGLSQTVSWLYTDQFAGWSTIGADIDWSATFSPAQGSTMTPGEPLPDGAYAFTGSIDYRLDGRSARFDFRTVEALQYSTECVAAGIGWSPFRAGTVRVAVRNNADMGFAQITYTDCQAKVVLMSA